MKVARPLRRSPPSARRGLAIALALPSVVACGGQEFTAGTPDAGPGFCASQPANAFALCSDFDEASFTPVPWPDLLTKGGAPVTADDESSVSPPSSLLASAPALAAGAAASQAFVSKTGLPAGAVHIAFDLRIDALSFPSNAAGATIVPALFTQGRYELLLAFAPSTASSPFDFVLVEIAGLLDAGSSVTVHDLTPLIAQASDGGVGLGSWESVKIDIDQGTRGATITVGSASTLVALDAPIGSATGERTFSIGVQATPPTGATKIRFDNVTYSNAD